MRWQSAGVLALVALLASTTRGDEVDQAIAAVLSVGSRGAGGEAAATAMQKLSRLDAADLPRLFAALDGANPLAANYLRASIEAVVDRTNSASKKLPLDALASYLTDRQHSPAGRRLAYELIVRVDPDAPQRWLPQLLGDPSVELRREAVAWKMNEARKLKAKPDQIAAYSAAFDAAIDDDQVKELSVKLKELGVAVDVARHFGFLQKWHVVGPFDNRDEQGYAAPHGPEGKPLDLNAVFTGSHDAGEVRWKVYATADEYGKVDFNTAVGKHKGAIAYAVNFFASDKARPIELRWCSKNACKLWLNDKQIDAREVYHQDGGPALDQYIARGELRMGRNTIFVKVCQNEQTEPWAQDWVLQLRVCDAAGAAVLSEERNSTPKEKK